MMGSLWGLWKVPGTDTGIMDMDTYPWEYLENESTTIIHI